MKLCSSVLISAIFHAAVLWLPLTWFETRTQELISVVVLGVAEGEEGAGGGVEQPGSGAPEQRTVKTKRVEDEAATRDGQGVDTMIAAARAAFEDDLPIEPAGDVAIVVANAKWNGAGESPAVSAPAGGQAGEAAFSTGGAGTGGSGNGIGAVGGGSGIGLVGDGNGGGGVGVKPTYAGVAYAHTPKPAYPEQARKAGWEGTVMLGVLVNVGGKAEKIEIKGSSGHATLDQAAVEGLKRWLFRPARYGEKAVESWVKIPVVFRLADVKD